MFFGVRSIIQMVLIPVLIFAGTKGWGAFNLWKNDRVHRTVLEQVRGGYEAALAEKDSEITRLNDSHAAMTAEVLWARDRVSKLTKRVENLKDEATDELQECLDVPVPAVTAD